MSSLPWFSFVLLVLLLLALDLGVFNRSPRRIDAGAALRATGYWVLLALAWNVCLGLMYQHHWLGVGERVGTRLSGYEAALQFFSAYLVEESLSVDNLFVMALVFRYFAVPEQYQHRVLFFGILGALVFRGIFIGAGLAFINRFTWAVYVFGALLVYTALRMLLAKDDDMQPERNPFLRAARRFFPVTDDYHGDRFFVRVAGRIAATPLCLALFIIEASDIVFAVDSVPAVFAVTRDPFIAFTSNVCAILGLRALYFALAAVMNSFRYIKFSLVLVLGFVGLKMLLTHYLPIDNGLSLLVILSLLAAGMLASLLSKPTTITTDDTSVPSPEAPLEAYTQSEIEKPPPGSVSAPTSTPEESH
jgi:tellurite resistance protein TerC